jgi:uncharacterized protein YbjT (DUF2867 family)/ketosteroid isomerase-like protein
MRTVLVIGATGTTGRHIVSGLLHRGADVRALVRTPLTAGLPAAVTVIEGRIEDADALAAAAAGADAAFLLWPSWDEEQVDAVVGTLAGHVEHVVYLSAARLQGDDDGAMDGIYARVEAAIQAADVTWTFLRAGGFAANTLEWAGQIRTGDVVRTPFPDAARPLVHERDLAEVAVRGLLDADMPGRAFTVTGNQVLTQREQVAAIGAAIGRDLRVETQPLEEARSEYAAKMGPDFAAHALAHWASLIDIPERVRDGVHEVLGRPPRPFEEWARDHREDFVQRSTAEVAHAYADALRAGDLGRAFGLLAPDVVRVAPLETDGRAEPVQGLAAIAANAAARTEHVTLDAVEVSEPLVGGDRFAIQFTFAETLRATGEPQTTVKLSLCTVEAARIVREDVFYFTKPQELPSRDNGHSSP